MHLDNTTHTFFFLSFWKGSYLILFVILLTVIREMIGGGLAPGNSVAMFYIALGSEQGHGESFQEQGTSVWNNALMLRYYFEQQ